MISVQELTKYLIEFVSYENISVPSESTSAHCTLFDLEFQIVHLILLWFQVEFIWIIFIR